MGWWVGKGEGCETKITASALGNQGKTASLSLKLAPQINPNGCLDRTYSSGTTLPCIPPSPLPAPWLGCHRFGRYLELPGTLELEK